MIDYRPFRNTDPPATCQIWRQQTPLRAVFQPLTPSILETTVLSKPFFDYEGFIVAIEDGEPIGFVHAGFAPSQDGRELSTAIGATCMLSVADPSRRGDVARELLRRSEQYLRERGARQLFGGAHLMIAPFYLGLYGGASVSGVLATDQFQLELFRAAGYVEAGRNSIMQRQLVSFRPQVDRQQMQLKRSMLVDPSPDPLSKTWWEACTMGLADRFSYVAKSRAGESECGSVTFWDVEPLASGWGIHARGLCELKIQVSQDRETMTLYLLGESLRMMAGTGVTMAEARVEATDDPLQPMLARLGFREVEQAVVLRKADG